MINTRLQKGFSFVEVIIVIVVVAIIALLGYVAWNQIVNTNSSNTSQKAVAEDVPTAPEIKTVSDLDQADTTLDKVDVGGSDDTAQLDQELEAF